MTSPNSTHDLGERSLAFLIRAADQLVRAERADILASEAIHRRDLRLLRRLATRENDEVGTRDRAADSHDGTNPAPTTDAASTAHHDSDHPRHARMRFGGLRLRHLLARGWVSIVNGRPAITSEGRTALDRIEDRLAASRRRIESVLTPEVLATTTEALSSIVEELGGTERLREVRRRRHLTRRMREQGPRHGFGHHEIPVPHGFRHHGAHRHGGFRGHRDIPSHGHGDDDAPRHGFGDHDARYHGGFPGHRDIPSHGHGHGHGHSDHPARGRDAFGEHPSGSDHRGFPCGGHRARHGASAGAHDRRRHDDTGW